MVKGAEMLGLPEDGSKGRHVPFEKFCLHGGCSSDASGAILCNFIIDCKETSTGHRL